MYTSHGHHIPGTVMDEGESRPTRARCGGANSCRVCRQEVEDHIVTQTTPEDFLVKAKRLVFEEVNPMLVEKFGFVPVYDVYVVKFTYILGYWKALLATTVPDDLYFEVTYNKEKSGAYVDAYEKRSNRFISD